MSKQNDAEWLDELSRTASGCCEPVFGRLMAMARQGVAAEAAVQRLQGIVEQMDSIIGELRMENHRLQNKVNNIRRVANE